MSTATLIFSGGTFLCSAATLLIVAKIAHDAKATKTKVEARVDQALTKVNHNAAVLKTALSAMEL